MAKVWILVYSIPYESDDILGVYSTLSAAESAKQVEIDTRTRGVDHYLFISEWTVDGPTIGDKNG